MALVTVQRSPSPSGSAETEEKDSVDAGQDSNVKSPRQRSESYFTVKGAAFILPQSDYERTYAKRDCKSQGDIQTHLQAMFSLLRPNDTIKVAVKLEGSHTRYLAVVSCIGRQDTEESVILGINLEEKIEIGLIVPIWAHTNIELDGDGGFSIKADNNVHIFKPVSVQAMWSALQSLNKVVKIATDNLYIPRGLTHTWVGFYEAKLSKDTVIISEWNVLADIDSSYRLKSNNKFDKDAEGEEDFYRMLKTELKLVMMTVDLEEVTCRYVREVLEQKLEMDLKKYKGIIDLQMFEIMGQMDAPSKILDYLYLGSEWNASNLEELQQNGVHYILNISREIDNFFTGILHYMNVREWDVEQSDLMKYWEDTHKFINKARKRGSKALVHCKMGISRSASTVIAYLMKEFKWSLEEAHDFTKSKRSIINPNTGFWKQLVTYEGILKASWHRESFERKEGLPDKPKDDLPEDPEFRSAEDMLAVNVGKDLPESSDLPILHTEQDIEIGSRSADSTEESLPDQLSPNVTDDLGAVKKKRCPRLDSKAVESGDFLSSYSSESTDSDSLSSDTEVTDDKVFLPIDIPAVSVFDRQDENKFARPKEQRAKSESDKSKLGVEGSVQSLSRESSVSKFKPDGSWIKPDLPEKENERADDDPGLEMQIDTQEGALETIKTNTIDMVELPVESDNTADIQNISEENTAEKDEISLNKTVGIEIENDNKETEIADVQQKDTVLGANLIPSEDFKVLEPYLKENIPWNVGTVRKQTEDLEEKYGSVAQRKSESVKETELSDKTEDDCKAKTDVTAEEVVETTADDNTTQTAESPEVEVAPEMKAEAIAIDKDTDKGQISVESPKFERVDKDQRTAESPKSKRTVYDLEEIDLPEGIVKKTMMEIEERNRLSVSESPRKRIQRSSSLKSNRVTPKAKDRDNERRKTCIAILSPTYNRSEKDQSAVDDLNLPKACHDPEEKTDLSQQEECISQASFQLEDSIEKEDDVKKQTGTVKIYKYMDEELEVEEGMVRKQTLDIEHKAKEIIPNQASLKPEKHQTELHSQSIVSSESSLSTKQVSTLLVEEKNQTEPLSENVTHATESLQQSAETVEKLDNKSNELAAITIESIKSTLYDRGKKSDDSASDDQMSKESIPCTPVNIKSKSGSHSGPESRFDPETLHLIREIGSALMNSPAKSELEERKDDEVQEGESRVNFFVRKIEKNIRTSKKKKKREIVIIEKSTCNLKGSDDNSKIPSDSTAEQQKHSVQQSICDSNEINEASIYSLIDRGSPVARRNTFPSSFQFDQNVSPKSERKLVSVKWSPNAKRDSVFEKCDVGDEQGYGKSHDLFRTAEITGNIDSMTDDSAQSLLSVNLNLGADFSKDVGELTESEGCSVKSLVDKFTAKSTASSASVVSTSDIVFVSSPTTTIADTSVKLSGHMIKATGAAKSPPKHDKPPLKHRQSEPVISLSEVSLQMFSKTVGSYGLEEKDVLHEEVEVQSTEIPQENVSDRLEPSKTTEKNSDVSTFTGDSKRTAFRQKQTRSECEGSAVYPFEERKLRTRKTYGKSHPLAKLEPRNSMRTNPFYSTM